MSKRQLHLNAFLMHVGHHEAAWRHPRTDAARAGDVQHYHRAGADRRARQARLDLLRRRPRAVGQRQAQLLRPVRADHPAVGDRGGDRADRADRHRVHHLQRAVPPGPQVRLARPPQRRAGRLEHRHLRHRGRGAQLQPRHPHLEHADRYERAAEFLDVATKLWDSWEDDALGARQGGRALRRHRPDPRRSSTAASTSRCAARSTCRARRRATRCWSRPGRPRTARSSPPGTPRRSSPRSRPSPTARPSTPTSRSRLARYGRSPGPAQDPARHLADHRLHRGRGASGWRPELNDLIVPEYGLTQLSNMLGVDLFDHPLDGPLPDRPAGRGRHQRQQEPVHAGRRAGAAGEPDHPPAARPARRRARSPGLRRHAGADRRPDRAVVHQRRRRRLQRHAAVPCRAGWRTSSTTWCPNCSAAACSAPSTPARRCATTTACRARPASSPPSPSRPEPSPAPGRRRARGAQAAVGSRSLRARSNRSRSGRSPLAGLRLDSAVGLRNPTAGPFGA